MGFRRATLQRMDKRVDELIRGFSGFVHTFNKRERFTGPTVYFHCRTLERLQAHGSAKEALEDDGFLESLYATLASWGMHRMGRRGARMVNFDAFKASLLSQLKRIEDLENLKLTRVPAGEVLSRTRELWRIISSLRIGKGETKIVIGTKAMHHLIPELVPPIDRHYTLRFFFENTTLNQGDKIAFAEVFPRFHRIATTCGKEIASLIGVGAMSTSSTKVIDNAIVGYGIQRLQIEEEEE